MSETETGPSQNAFDSEMRLRTSKSGLESKTDLECYNTGVTNIKILQLLQLVFHFIHRTSRDSRNDKDPVRTSGGHVLCVNLKSKVGLFGRV